MRDAFIRRTTEFQRRMAGESINAALLTVDLLPGRLLGLSRRRVRPADGAIRPGAIAEDVNAAAEEVYRSAWFEAGYRTGRAIGCSFLEQPELKAGDKTVLRAGMTFAVDGGITVLGEFGARIGDSIVMTESGYEDLTPYPKDLRVL